MKKIKKNDYRTHMKNVLRNDAWRHDPSDPARTKYYFGCLEPNDAYTDASILKQAYQDRKTKGFDQSECWDFGDVLCKFALPRLKYFRDHHAGIPMYFCKLVKQNIGSEDVDSEYVKILDQLIWALEAILDESYGRMDDRFAQKCGYENFTEASMDPKFFMNHRSEFGDFMKDHQDKINSIMKEYSWMLFNLYD